MIPKLVIYHANCMDGFTSAWVAKGAIEGPIEFVAALHRHSPPDVTGKDVYIFDFAYPRDILLEMKSKAASLVVLDHHKTNQEDLQGLDFCHFDMKRSGAAMTWDYFYNYNQPGSRHWLVNYVQDRDLWTWLLQDSKAVNYAIAARPFTFTAWDEMASKSVFLLSLEGKALEQYRQTLVEAHLKQAYITSFENQEIPVANVASGADLSSELGNILSKGYPFAIIWSYLGEGLFRYSLRNNGECDVAEVAKKYGGGGHPKSAGFTSKDFLVPSIAPLLLKKLISNKEPANGT